MKKLFTLALTAIMLLSLSPAVHADAQTSIALDAFYALTDTTAHSAKTSAVYLQEVMDGKYAVAPSADTAQDLAAELTGLARVTTKDIAAYASANKLTVAQVRNRYHRALANAVQADISLHPAQDERARNVQAILSLFMTAVPTSEDVAARQTIRTSMTPKTAKSLAADAQLPVNFIEFIIMDEQWADEDWKNDQAWKITYAWGDTSYDDSPDDLSLGSRDTAKSSRVAELQERLIALGYLDGKADGIFGERTRSALIQYQRANGLTPNGVYDDDDTYLLLSSDPVARWDYENSFDPTPDNTPDNSPNRSSKRKADNTPDRTPDNTPDRTPDNTPDRTPDNTP